MGYSLKNKQETKKNAMHTGEANLFCDERLLVQLDRRQKRKKMHFFTNEYF